MQEKNLDHEILKLIEAQPEMNINDIAHNLSVTEELVKKHIENLNDIREKILIVSYGRNIYDSLKMTLEPENYCVVKTSRGSSAFETVKYEKPDLVLVDTGPEDTESFEICRQLKASSRFWWIPILMLNEKGEVKDRVKALESGVDDYVTTPLDYLELKARIGMLLRRTRI
jgi:DNA-binding response OmpR family regulator